MVHVTGNDQLRAAGHRIADYIYENRRARRALDAHRLRRQVRRPVPLQIADADGRAPTALTSNEPIISAGLVAGRVPPCLCFCSRRRSR